MGLLRLLTNADVCDGLGAAQAAAVYPFCSSRRIHSLLRCISLRKDSTSDGLRRSVLLVFTISAAAGAVGNPRLNDSMLRWRSRYPWGLCGISADISVLQRRRHAIQIRRRNSGASTERAIHVRYLYAV
jgi:hypothetical protein